MKSTTVLFKEFGFSESQSFSPFARNFVPRTSVKCVFRAAHVSYVYFVRPKFPTLSDRIAEDAPHALTADEFAAELVSIIRRD